MPLVLIIDMMMQKRITEQVIKDIIVTCQGMGANRTKIVYAANLNLRTVRCFLDGLSGDGPLEVIPGEVELFRTRDYPETYKQN